jgi:hypothetical protein
MGAVLQWLDFDVLECGHRRFSGMGNVGVSTAIQRTRMPFVASWFASRNTPIDLHHKFIKDCDSAADQIKTAGLHPGEWGSFMLYEGRHNEKTFCIVASSIETAIALKLAWTFELDFHEVRKW